MTALNCAVLTISDSRSLKEDTSGALLAELIAGDGHVLADRNLVVAVLGHVDVGHVLPAFKNKRGEELVTQNWILFQSFNRSLGKVALQV